MPCPDENRVLDFAAGRLAEGERAVIDEHVDGCPHCQELFAALGKEWARRTPPASRATDGGGGASSVGPEVAGTREASGAMLQAGARVAARYRILRFIARGGMGEVYEAEDETLGTRVALKFLQPILAADPQARARLLREVRLARQVTHENVCRLYDLAFHATDGGAEAPFLSMELLEGETLGHRLRRAGRMTEAEAAPIVRQMAAGLGAAHRAGVVHRDFKSENVMLVPAPGREGGLRVVITDFGLARSVEPAATGTTTSGALVGTPAYMAPEQLTGGNLDARTDIYALGVVLYEMVCGRLPFSGRTPIEIASRRLVDPPPEPRSQVPTIDGRWNAVVVRCLQRDAGARFADVDSVVAALAGPPVAARANRSWIAAAAAAMVVALVAAFGVARWKGSRRAIEVTVARPVLQAPAIVTPVAAPAVKTAPAATATEAAAPPARQRAAAVAAGTVVKGPWIIHGPLIVYPSAPSSAPIRPAVSVAAPAPAAATPATEGEYCDIDIKDAHGARHHYGGARASGPAAGAALISSELTPATFGFSCMAGDGGGRVLFSFTILRPDLVVPGRMPDDPGTTVTQLMFLDGPPPAGLAATRYTSHAAGSMGMYTFKTLERRAGTPVEGTWSGVLSVKANPADPGVLVDARFRFIQR